MLWAGLALVREEAWAPVKAEAKGLAKGLASAEGLEQGTVQWKGRGWEWAMAQGREVGLGLVTESCLEARLAEATARATAEGLGQAWAKGLGQSLGAAWAAEWELASAEAWAAALAPVLAGASE